MFRRPSTLVAASLLFAAVLVPRPAIAVDGPGDDDMATACRPTVTCTAEVVKPGELQVEVGGQHSRASGVNEWSAPVLFKLGLLDWVEAQVGSNGFTALSGGTSTQYLDNVFLGPKVRFLEQSGALPTLAVSAEVSIPLLSADGYARVTDLFFVAYASEDLGPVHFDVNGGLNVWNLSSAAVQGTVSGVLSKTLPLNLGVEGEAYYLSDAAPLVPHDGGARAALTFAPKPWLVFDAGGDVGFFWSVRKYTLFLGATVIPVVFWRSPSASR
jgi:Putative MetA-pathway of phenol degradation